MKNKIESFVVKYIEKKSKLPQDCDLSALKYIDDGYIDSMGLLKFVIELEKNFDIQISEEDMLSPDFRTFGGLVNMVENKILQGQKS